MGMLGNCVCGTAFTSSADYLIRKCRRCQIKEIRAINSDMGASKAGVIAKSSIKPPRLNKLSQAILQVGE